MPEAKTFHRAAKWAAVWLAAATLAGGGVGTGSGVALAREASVAVESGSLAVAPQLVLFTRRNELVLQATDGTQVLKLTPIIWGPNWGWTGIQGSFSAEGDSATASLVATVAPERVPVRFDVRVSQRSPREYSVRVVTTAERDVPITLATLAVEAGRVLHGSGRAAAVADGQTQRLSVPLGRGVLSEALESVTFTDEAGRAYTLAFPRRASAQQEGTLRLVLGAERLAGGQARELELVLTLPEDASFIRTAADAPMPENWAQWYEWRGTGRGREGAAGGRQRDALDLSGWLDAPAGRQGRVTRAGEKLMYGGREIKFWGVNASFAACAPPKDRAERQSAFYARYGINAVRLHKYADGRGWAGILRNGATDFDPEALDRMDHYVARLKERGIFVKLSANFGALPLGPADFASLEIARDYQPGNNGWARADQGALWFSEELQRLQMEQLLAVLRHTNPHTGMRYADDPAVMCVELVNENSALFFTTMAALQRRPTVRQLAGRAFFEWLKAKYGTEQRLLEAWGPRAMRSFTAENLADESWESGIILPVGNPWFFDPDNLNGSQAFRRQRLLDTMQFLYEMQNRFYDRFVAAVRETGYAGEIVASNWQAGRAMSHFYNLHSDARIGMIDRHNYFGGGGSMLSAPGSGMLSSGLQQVAGLPFMLSEWIHTFPNEFGVEGPAILGAYGMGLNGWDVSFMFQNGDDGGFRNQLGDEWDVVAPQIIGIFPAVARQIYRGDVKEAELVFSRNVHVPSLAEGKLGFDDRVEQGYDVKEFGSDAVPAATLAIGRSLVTFTDRFTPTERVDLGRFIDGQLVRSSTGQLAWRPGSSPRDGHFTLSSPGTQAVVGFANGVRAELADVVITPESEFAAVYVSAVDRDDTIATGRRLLVTTMGRVRNTNQRMVAGTLLDRGTGPMRVEPVRATLQFKRAGAFTVHVLDHDGQRTGRQLPVRDGTVVLDSASSRTPYYEITFP